MILAIVGWLLACAGQIVGAVLLIHDYALAGLVTMWLGVGFGVLIADKA